MIETIETAGKSEVAAVFGDEATLKGIVADLTGLEALADTGRIGEILYGIRTELADSSDVLQYLDLACAMAVLEQARTAQSLEDVLAELEKLDAGSSKT